MKAKLRNVAATLLKKESTAVNWPSAGVEFLEDISVLMELLLLLWGKRFKLNEVVKVFY